MNELFVLSNTQKYSYILLTLCQSEFTSISSFQPVQPPFESVVSIYH